MQPQSQHSIAVLLFDDVLSLDLAGPTDALLAANHYWREANNKTLADRFYDFHFVSCSTSTVRAQSGLKLVADRLLAEVSPSQYDAVLVPGGFGVFEAAHNRSLINWIKEAHKTNCRTISVCSGALLLAEAGILEGKTTCTHWSLCQKLAATYPAISVDPESLYVADGNIITSAGVTSGIDMTLALIEADLGREIALKVARRLVVHLKRPGAQSQFSWPLKAQTSSRGNPVDNAVKWILDHINEPMSVERVAAAAGMSVRSFTRHFRAQVGDSPARFIEQARLENARLLLEENKGVALSHAAAASGFSSTEHLTRAFERRFGMHPKNYRQAFDLN